MADTELSAAVARGRRVRHDCPFCAIVGGAEASLVHESGTRRGLQPKTFASYWQQVRLYIAPHLGPVPLRNLTPGRITRWMADLAAGDGSRAPRSIGCARAVLRLALQDAVWGGLLPSNPAGQTEPPRAKPQAGRRVH